MPGMYKVKSCIQCGKTDRMRGKYCSLSCSNLGRNGHSEKTKENISIAMNSPEVIGLKHYNHRKRREATEAKKHFKSTETIEIVPQLSDDDWAVGIPDLDDAPNDPADAFIRGF